MIEPTAVTKSDIDDLDKRCQTFVTWAMFWGGLSMIWMVG